MVEHAMQNKRRERYYLNTEKYCIVYDVFPQLQVTANDAKEKIEKAAGIEGHGGLQEGWWYSCKDEGDCQREGKSDF